MASQTDTRAAPGALAAPDPAAAHTAERPPASREEWDKAMADFERAKAWSEAYETTFWTVENAFKAEADQVPHTTVEIYGRTVSTAQWDEVGMARSNGQSLRYVEKCAYADVKARQELVDAADARDATIAEIDQRLGRSAVNERMDALSYAIGATEEVLLNMPAPDSEALLWKVNRLYPQGEGTWAASFEAQTQADLRRFLLIGRA